MDEKYLSINAAVIIPGLQAMTSALFVGGAVGGIVAAGGSLDLLTVSPVALGVIAGSISGLASWRRSLEDWQVLLYGVDYQDQEPVTVIEPQPVRVELTSDNGNRGQYAQLPASPGQLIELGQGISSGDSFSVARWTGAGGPFSRGEFEQLRGELLKLGWVQWKSERDNCRGVTITRGGRAVFRHFASMTISPPLIRE